METLSTILTHPVITAFLGLAVGTLFGALSALILDRIRAHRKLRSAAIALLVYRFLAGEKYDRSVFEPLVEEYRHAAADFSRKPDEPAMRIYEYLVLFLHSGSDEHFPDVLGDVATCRWGWGLRRRLRRWQRAVGKTALRSQDIRNRS